MTEPGPPEPAVTGTTPPDDGDESPPAPTDPSLGDNGLPKAHVTRRKRRQISLVWIIPIVAVLIGAYLVFHSIRSQGPKIDIQFKTAEGLEAGKTKIRYKNVDIGTVQTITLGHDNKSVIVTAQMTRNATDLLVDDTRFWIVKPRIAGGQISGLTTLLSGSFIGMDIGKSTESKREFQGLDAQPSVTTDEPGREFKLHAADGGSLDIGSPVFFRRFQVGEVTAVNLDDDGKGVTALVFIRSPNEHYVTENTRFWQASGVDVSIDGSGVKISTQSLVSVVVGGVAFQSPATESPGGIAVNDASFTLFDDEHGAMKRTDAQLEKYIAYFSDSIRGLSVGAQVEFRGYAVGEVRSIEMKYDRAKQDIYFPVEFVLYKDVLPARIDRAEREAGSPMLDSASTQGDARYRNVVVNRGLRAQLRAGNLLTGQKYLALDYFKNATPLPANTPVRDAQGIRLVPTTPGSLDELQETLSSIAKKIDKIPFVELAGDIRQTLQQMQVSLKNVDKLVTNLNGNVAPAVTDALTEVRRTMKNANETLLSTDAPVQQDLRGTLTELNRAAASLRLLTDYLQRHPESLLRGKTPDVKFGDVPATPPLAVPAPSSPPPAPARGTPELVK